MQIKNSPNVVPLCDILLVLLIIFMVITPMAQTGINVKLPDFGNGPGNTPLVLNIDKNGMVTVNHEHFVNLERLGTRLSEVFQKRQDKTIFVKAHHRISYQYLVDTVDVVKHAGADQICVIPNPTDAQQEQSIPVYQKN